MLHVIQGIDGLKAAGLYEKMFQTRYDIFVREMGWALPHKNGMEIDLYDTREAVYLVKLDELDNIISSARLLPTSMPHLMEEIFPHLIAETHTLPKGPSVLELTRYFVDRSNTRLREFPVLSGEVFCGVMEYCVQEAISSLLIVMDTRFLPQIQEIGWAWQPLGLPQEFGGGPEAIGGGHALAVEVMPSEETLQLSSQIRKVPVPILAQSERAPVSKIDAALN